MHTATQHTYRNPLEHASREQLAELARLHRMSRDDHIIDHLERAADDIGRLRRRLTSELDQWTLTRVGDRLEAIFAIIEPTAADLVLWHAPGSDTAVVEALRIVDERTNRFIRRLGLEPR